MKLYYNLDSPIESYFNDARVINTLLRNDIKNLYQLYCCNLKTVLHSYSCGKKTERIIIDTVDFLKGLSEKKLSVEYIKEKYNYLLDSFMVVSKNSDNIEFRGQTKLKRFLEIYEKENLSPRDLINSNMIIMFLIEHEGKKPLDYISIETAEFDDLKDAYNYLNEIISDMEEEKEIIFKKYNGIFMEKQTLEEIGQEYGVTRERIRQINKKTTDKIYNKLNAIYPKIINTFKGHYYIPLSNPMLRIYCEYLHQKGYLTQEKIFEEKVYVRDNELIDLVATIEKEVEDKNVYSANLEKSVLKLFGKKYLIKNNKILKNNTLINYVPIVLEKLGRSVNLNSENDTELIYSMLENEYNVFTEYKDSRNLERIMSESSVLVDSRTYISEKYQKRMDMEKIFEYIETNQITNAQMIYTIFKELWNDIDIYSHVGVYGYLKYFYPDRYNYAGRSFLISILGENTSWGDLVIDLIKEKKEPITYNEISQLYPALNNMIWINLEANFEDLIYWGDNSYYCKSMLSLNEKDMNEITIYIFNNNPIRDRELYSYLLLNKSHIINDNYLHGEKQLLKFIKTKYADVVNYNADLKVYYI